MERLVLRGGAMACAALTIVMLVAGPAHAQGPVAAYGFGEGTGSAVADASGNGNHGTASSTSWAPLGRFGSALSFASGSSWVTVPDSPSLDLTTQLTLEAWVNPTALAGSWRTVIFKQTAGGMAYSLFAANGSNLPLGQVQIGGEQNAVGPAALPLNAWTHLASTYDGATLRLFVNGTEVASKPQTGSAAVSNGVLRIGGNSIWSEPFRGLIDEVRIYDRALTGAAIQSDMATPVTPQARDTEAPAVQLTSPAAGPVSGTVTVAATASDDRGVAGVRFRLDGSDLGEDTSAPYEVQWDTTQSAAGSHTLTAVARDAAGNQTTSAPVTVSVTSSAASFVNDRVVIGLDEPTDLAWTPDGRMLVTERDGTVWGVPPGSTEPEPLLQLPSVRSDNERGLLGIAVDPAFEQNGYVYLFYTHGSLRNRVSRFPLPGGAEQVVWENTVDSDVWHQGGDLQFGPDGFLYISVGDHLRADTAQSLTSYNGKILRVAADGSVPADNPFHDGAGPNLDAIWARGLRNPFRFSIDPVTGWMFIGDVGQGTTEEVNRGVRGANYGWPLCEGTCSAAGTTNPVHTYANTTQGAAVIGGFVYRGSQFPPEYQGTYFFADYVQNWIKRLTLDGAGNVTAVQSFEPPDGRSHGPYGDIVALAQGPDGALWYIDAGPFELDNAGSIRRIRNAGANQPPTAHAAASPPSGPAPLTVSFSSAGSADPEGRPLTYRWSFGDGATSTAANPTHTYSHGRYTARLTVSDGTSETISAPLTITAGSAPTARILTPANGQTFRAGDVIAFSGEGQDVDGAVALSWKVVFHHDAHIHPVLDGVTGASGTLTVPASGHSFHGDTSYEIVLTVTDADGIQTTSSVTIRPEKAPVTLATSPAGLKVLLDGVTRTAPVAQDEVVGFRYLVEAPSPQSAHAFASWSDGGARAHGVTVPPGGLSLTAAFQPDAAPQGLVAAYSFDEGSGTTLVDGAGHGHTGTLSGPTWSAAGRHGGALSFDGSNDSVRIDDHAELDLSTGMTAEAWVNPSALGGAWRTILFKEQAAHMTYALYANTDTGRPTGQAYVGGQRDARGASPIATGTWTHLATTYDGATVRLYVNGTEVRALSAGGPMTVSTGPLKLGGNAIWGEWFAGLMDDVRLYNRALSAGEIQADMGTPVTG